MRRDRCGSAASANCATRTVTFFVPAPVVWPGSQPPVECLVETAVQKSATVAA